MNPAARRNEGSAWWEPNDQLDRFFGIALRGSRGTRRACDCCAHHNGEYCIGQRTVPQHVASASVAIHDQGANTSPFLRRDMKRSIGSSVPILRSRATSITRLQRLANWIPMPTLLW